MTAAVPPTVPPVYAPCAFPSIFPILQAGSDDSACIQSESKKPRLEPRPSLAADVFPATLLPPVAACAPDADATNPSACQPAPVDLEAAVCELLGATDDLLASTQLADEAGMADQLPTGTVGNSSATASAPADPSTEPTETHEQQPDQELSLQPTQPASSVDGASMPPSAGGLAAAPTCEPVACAAISAAAMLPPTTDHPVSATQPTQPLLPAPAAVPASPPTVPPPTHPAAPAPAAAAEPTLAPAAAPAASVALHDGSPDRLVRRPAPDSTQSAGAPTSVVNMLKGVRPAFWRIAALASAAWHGLVTFWVLPET